MGGNMNKKLLFLFTVLLFAIAIPVNAATGWTIMVVFIIMRMKK